MAENKAAQLTTIKSALISVYYKDGLEPIVRELHNNNVDIYSTGGSKSFIENLGILVKSVEGLTGFPEILGGRVKTLHPKIFGGILNRRANTTDQREITKFEIPSIDLVIVDLYPFEETLASGASHEDIIEKIDIGGIALIRAAAKNFNDVLIVPSVEQYADLLACLKNNKCSTTVEERQKFAMHAFAVSSNYDSKIFQYFNAQDDVVNSLRLSENQGHALRYGENPHQKGTFFGDLGAFFNQLHGKELSYNNLLDVDAAINLIRDFKSAEPTFGILKHNNACGFATKNTLKAAYEAALAGDPVSAFGGVLVCNKALDKATADLVNNLFCEVIIAPSFDEDALEILKSKKNRILLVDNGLDLPQKNYRSALNGILAQDKDNKIETAADLSTVTKITPKDTHIADLLFANKLVKHTKSNTIVLVKNQTLLASGTGQTSRVDALNQAIHKCKTFKFDLKDAVMASDAFFPFPDCVEIAHNEGILTVIQPGGSIKDELSIEYCDKHGMAMVFTGVRHFKH
jgi:phosphoribosylaminoimidazolecarboxamide formyltransferase/IMP cyclohydrolase